MKRLMILISATLVCCDLCSAGVSVVKNGSFENNGNMSNVTQSTRPQYWCSVGYDQSKYGCSINQSWSTQGKYSLTMDAYLYTGFAQNDSATITQSVYLANAGQIIFDVALSMGSGAWDTNAFTASVLIDNTEIWNSDGLAYTNGFFAGHIVVDINETFRDSNPHFLTLRLKADTSEFTFGDYYAQWDSVGLSTPCGSLGYMPADLTHDCIVDINDLAVFAEGWLTPNGLGLTSDSDVNFVDFAVLGRSWGSNTNGEAFIPDSNFVFLTGDLNDDGIVDFADFAVFANNWRGQGGSCVRWDINGDGVIDFKDLALLFGQWTKTGGLYGL